MAAKRKKGPRTQSGQLSRAKNPSAPRPAPEPPIDELAIGVRAMRQAKLWGVNLVDRKGKSTLRDEKRGSYIGILRMIGIQSRGTEGISEMQYHAGVLARQIRVNYLKAIAAPNVLFDTSTGMSGNDAEAHAEFCKVAREKWDTLKSCIANLEQETRQPFYMSALDQCVFNDNGTAFGIGIIREILNRVHQRFVEPQKIRRAA